MREGVEAERGVEMEERVRGEDVGGEPRFEEEAVDAEAEVRGVVAGAGCECRGEGVGVGDGLLLLGVGGSGAGWGGIVVAEHAEEEAEGG